MISPTTEAISSTVRFFRSMARASASRMFMAGPSWSSLPHDEVAQEILARRRQERLGVKLHALDGQRLVPHRHDLLLRRLGGDVQTIRDTGPFDQQRVVARRLERIGQAREEPLAVVR